MRYGAFMTFNALADDATIAKTIEALGKRGIAAEVVANGAAAKERVLALIPKGAEVMNISSVTLETIGLDKEINESGKYDSVKNKLNKMNRETQRSEMRKIGAAPDWAVGSVHAVTRDGQILIASNTGSQLGAYAYAAGQVIWVVGAQKLVNTLEDAHKRVYEYVLPLENEHMMKLYNVGSNVSKLLILSKEITPNRVTMIIVKEVLGF